MDEEEVGLYMRGVLVVGVYDETSYWVVARFLGHIYSADVPVHSIEDRKVHSQEPI